MGSKVEGDLCEKCDAPMERLHHAFYWRGEFFDGVGCRECRSLYAIRGEEMPPLRPQAPGGPA